MKTYHISLQHNQTTIHSHIGGNKKMQINVTDLSSGKIVYFGDCEEFLYNNLQSDIEAEFQLNHFCCSQTESIIIVTDEADYLIEKVLELIY